VGRLFFGDDQQHRRGAFVEQGGGFEHAMFQAVAGGGEGGHFAGFAAHDRPQADHRVVHRQAELGRRQRLVVGQVAEDLEGARGFAVPGNKHQRQVRRPSASGQPTLKAMRARRLRRRRCMAGRNDTSGKHRWRAARRAWLQACQSSTLSRPGAQARHWAMLK
jgi:hypothetical protein